MNTNNNFLDEVSTHIGAYPLVIIGENKKIISFNSTFLDLFELAGKDLRDKPLPENIDKFLTSTHGFFEISKNTGETIKISYLTTLLEQQNNSFLYLITFKDLTYTKLKSNLKDSLLKITQSVYSSEDITPMLTDVLNILSQNLALSSSFVCLFDNANKSFYIDSQRGLKDLYKCHSCSFSKNKEQVPDDKESCFNAYSSNKIHSQDLTNHCIIKYIDKTDMEPLKNSIVHIPLCSEDNMIGILNLVAPKFSIKNLMKETDVLTLIANEISIGVKRARLIKDIKQYADNLEKIIKVRTDQLREKDAQLIQSGKLATLGELATGIAHEINQPLGGISLITQGLIMAKSRGKLENSLLDNKLKSIMEQIDRINNIITHLKTFARQTDNILVETDVRKPLLDVFKLIGQQLVNKEIDVVLDIPDSVPIIMAEHNRLEQIFLNLLSNARDALEDMEDRVRILSVSDELPEKLQNWHKKIVVKVYAQNQELVMEFQDNATGIAPDIINKIFDPFYTTKEIGRGTGLGLSITYGIVRDFNGIIQIESTQDEGSTFILKFPKVTGEKGKMASEKESPPAT